MERNFKCPTCGATKTIVKRADQTRVDFLNRLPAQVPCGWRGCEDYAKPVEEGN